MASRDLFEISALMQQQAEAFERMAEEVRTSGDGSGGVSVDAFNKYVETVNDGFANWTRFNISFMVSQVGEVKNIYGHLKNQANVVQLLAGYIGLPDQLKGIEQVANESAQMIEEHLVDLEAYLERLQSQKIAEN